MTDVEQIISNLEDMKAVEINHLDVASITSMTDHMIIVTGNSVRHTRAIMQSLACLHPSLSLPKPRIEGDDYCEWILVNFGDVIVHIMLPDIRAYYGIDKLWSQEV